MAKKKKFPYKFVTPGQLEDYRDMGKEELVENLLEKNQHLKTSKASKKGSDYLKELAKDISEFRKENSVKMPNDDGTTVNSVIEQLTEELKELKEIRDTKIADAIEEKKELEGGMNDAIKASQEHIDLILSLLSKLK